MAPERNDKAGPHQIQLTDVTLAAIRALEKRLGIEGNSNVVRFCIRYTYNHCQPELEMIDKDQTQTGE